MSGQTIAVIGGSGALGRGLMLRWARAGLSVIVGSRDQQKANEAALDANRLLGTATVRGMENVTAARSADIVALTVPFSQHALMLTQLHDAVQGKIVIDVTVPLLPPKVRTVHLPPGGSAAAAAQAAFGANVKVVSAFHNVAATHLQDLDYHIDCDVLVCGNDADARTKVVGLVKAAGMIGWQAGRIENSVIAEALTSGLIFINSTYKIDGAGIRITGASHEG